MKKRMVRVTESSRPPGEIVTDTKKGDKFNKLARIIASYTLKSSK